MGGKEHGRPLTSEPLVRLLFSVSRGRLGRRDAGQRLANHIRLGQPSPQVNLLAVQTAERPIRRFTLVRNRYLFPAYWTDKCGHEWRPPLQMHIRRRTTRSCRHEDAESPLLVAAGVFFDWSPEPLLSFLLPDAASFSALAAFA